MFAPGAGVAEDPATGSAAAALAGWLVRHAPTQSATQHWTVLQGEAIGRPSRIELEADVRDGAVQAVRVGGASVWSATEAARAITQRDRSSQSRS